MLCMEPDQLEKLRLTLIARRKELLGEGDIEIEPVLKDPAEKVDEDAAPLTEMNQVIASRRNKNRALELQRIEASLQRIAADPDDFGYCDDCGDDIPYRRLEIMPGARFCVRCADKNSPDRDRRRRHLADYME